MATKSLEKILGNFFMAELKKSPFLTSFIREITVRLKYPLFVWRLNISSALVRGSPAESITPKFLANIILSAAETRPNPDKKETEGDFSFFSLTNVGI